MTYQISSPPVPFMVGHECSFGENPCTGHELLEVISRFDNEKALQYGIPVLVHNHNIVNHDPSRIFEHSAVLHLYKGQDLYIRGYGYCDLHAFADGSICLRHKEIPFRRQTWRFP